MTIKFKLDVGDSLIERMLLEEGYEVVDYLREADVFFFVGGADVNPELYDERNTHSSVDNQHDEASTRLYYSDIYKPRVGVCRGGQFLNAMSGHRLHQHVENHAIGGTHPVLDTRSGLVYRCTSTHHQMMRIDDVVQKWQEDTPSLVLATAEIEGVGHDEPQIEAIWYPSTKSLCFQPHPEYVYKVHECRKLFRSYLDEFIIPLVN